MSAPLFLARDFCGLDRHQSRGALWRRSRTSRTTRTCTLKILPDKRLELDLPRSAKTKLDIDLSTQDFQKFCAILSEFALPRAIVDFERNAFVAWNPRFLERTGSSEDEIKSGKPRELLAFDESWLPLSDEKEGAKVEFISCAFRRSFGAEPVPGYIIRSQGKIGYVMLDDFVSPSVQFDQGRVAGREEERNRIIKAYHKEVSSSMIAALFLVETAKSELEEAGLPQAEAVSKASEKLTETAEKIADVLSNPEGNSSSKPR